ncbi:unnamed protein product [Phytophthora lilii]|uniref:Unnamed protein product n=1 Tax=Phytophthora lilii TaxID=2077276 RepID=A0A9W6TEG9_9STRA|nr:unnamed protein product [Phytophthora lilii]
MSSVGSGLCTPTHLNTEGWASSLDALKPYFNESYNAGILGYYGLSGLYTTTDFVIQGASANPPYSPEFWRSYKTSDALINALSVESFKTNSKYYPPAQEFCPDGVLGCEENCGETEACTEREEAGKSCLVVAMMFPSYDPGYFQARVFLPRTGPERVKLSTGNFGENGYGSKTDNPVDVDYPRLELMKFAASIVSDLPIGSMFSRFTLSDTHINDLLSKFSGTSHDSSEPEPYFHAACNWVKENYDLWADWIDELPVCTFQKHVSTRIVGCEEGNTIRRVEFEWKSPNPNNNSIPNDCDGGLTTLPSTITTTRSCEWICNNYRTGSGWVDFKPTCDPSFYDYNLSACDSSGYQSVQYYWKLPNPENHRLSAECQGGDDLPEPSRTKCGSVQSCADFCVAWQRTRTRTYPPRGVSSGLNKRWMDISIALVDNLPPTSAGSDSVIVISDKVSEQASFIPTSSNATLTEIACLFCTEYQVAHGLPRTIVMDRNVDFTSALRKGVIQVFKALTPCTDGKIETTNKLIAEYLRYFLKPHQDKWEDMLEAGEAFYNFHYPSSMHSATALGEPTASGNNRCNKQPF